SANWSIRLKLSSKSGNGLFNLNRGKPLCSSKARCPFLVKIGKRAFDEHSGFPRLRLIKNAAGVYIGGSVGLGDGLCFIIFLPQAYSDAKIERDHTLQQTFDIYRR